MKKLITKFALIALLVLPFLGFSTIVARAAGPICSVPGDYATINEAVNDVNCTTINVAAGTYNEHVNINRALILNGANMGIRGNLTRVAESIITGDANGALQITADNVTIDGFKVSSVTNALGSGIHMASSSMGAMIKNNIISGNQIGIYANSNGASTISFNLFDANNQPGASGGSAIYSEFTIAMTIDNNEFKNHTINSPVIFAAPASGVHHNLIFTNNNLHNNANASNVYVLGLSTGTFSGNTILSAPDVTGISFSGDDQNITVTKNIISNGARGIRVEDAGYGLGFNADININRNTITGNSVYGVGNITPNTTAVNATCNWWGSTRGPGAVGAGTGDKVTTNVTYTPWLTSSDLNGTCLGYPPGTLGRISGTKYIRNARNGNGENNENNNNNRTLAGVTIYLDTNNNGVLDNSEISTITGSNGTYNFPNLLTGIYHVREVIQAGWTQITPASGVYNITLAPGQNSRNNNFTNRLITTVNTNDDNEDEGEDD